MKRYIIELGLSYCGELLLLISMAFEAANAS